jgi:catechol 2,3-dioxygenase-like lactoylglutathione lyase family enzyme
MKRFHAHVRVEDLEASVRFYSILFGAAPAVRKPDYAKWMLDDPRVNFAITVGAGSPGLDHLGLQVETDDELATVAERLKQAGAAVAAQRNASCCYAIGNKEWTTDPGGISWETFHSFGEIMVYGADASPREPLIPASSGGCCPTDLPGSSCCGTPRARG